MRILIIGANGFIGSNVSSLLGKNHEVYMAGRYDKPINRQFNLDLLDIKETLQLLLQVKPEVIINCAGIVENSDRAKLNVQFTKNLLNAVIKSKLIVKRIIISGSAAEYGYVDKKDIPVNENTPLNADSGYGLSKKMEELSALEISRKNSLPLTVARIFNPIGIGMHERFLIPSLINQINDTIIGTRKTIEVSRLDALRDYINVRDIASAIQVLIENDPKRSSYNIGSGIATSNWQLIETIMKEFKLINEPELKETSVDQEKLVAVQADISRISNEFKWKPKYTVDETIKEIVDASRK